MDVEDFECVPDDEDNDQETGQVTAEKDTPEAHRGGWRERIERRNEPGAIPFQQLRTGTG
jgi:hypothetical protein